MEDAELYLMDISDELPVTQYLDLLRSMIDEKYQGRARLHEIPYHAGLDSIMIIGDEDALEELLADLQARDLGRTPS